MYAFTPLPPHTHTHTHTTHTHTHTHPRARAQVAFTLTTGPDDGRTVHLVAKNAQDRHTWTQILQACISKAERNWALECTRARLVRACVRVCVRACVRACVRVCVRVEVTAEHTHALTRTYRNPNTHERLHRTHRNFELRQQLFLVCVYVCVLCV